MCTVSWCPEGDGYTLCFNRDERLTRAPAEPPAAHQSNGVRYLAPLDGDFGGTWLAVNEFGLTLGLLNRYGVAGYHVPAEPRSRGLLVLDLIAQPSAREALIGLERLDLARVQPFSLVAIEPGQPARVAAWDGTAITALTHRPAGLLLTSSSATEPEVAAARRATFAAAEQYTPDRLTELHRSHLPERGRRSICMHREEAETQSFSRITVAADQIQLMHTPDAPCRGTELPALTLARHAIPCPAQH